MPHVGFAISEEDVESVLSSQAVRIANSEGRSFAEMAETLLAQLEPGAIERAALRGHDLDTQTRYAYEEIADQLVRMGVLEAPRELSRTVAFSVWPTDDTFGPAWVQFEIDKPFLSRLEDVAQYMKAAGSRPSATLLGLAAVELHLDAKWRGKQCAHSDAAEQNDVRLTRLHLDVCEVLAPPSDLRLSVSGRLESGGELEGRGSISLQDLKQLHAERPVGELLILDSSGIANDTLDGQELLQQIQEADQAEAAANHPTESMIG